MARAVTIRAVARQAGVGIATVSRVLNGAPGVAPDTAAKVRRAMAALNYQPSAAGRSLRSGASRALGVMVPTISNPIFALSLEGLEAVARERGFSTIIASSHYDPGKEETVVGDLKARGVEGMVLTLCSPSPAALEMVEAQGVPYVLLFNVLPPSAAPPAFVTVDNRGAVRDACAQLIADGHRRIAFLGGAFASSDRAAERYRGYCDAMEAAHLPVWPATEVPFLSDTPAFEDALSGLIARLSAPTALICSNDLLGLHALTAAKRLGIRVPDDLSVLGFDGLPMARLANPALSSIAQPAREMGAEAATILFDMLGGSGPRGAILPHTHQPGETVRSAPPDDRRSPSHQSTPKRSSR